MKLTEEEEEEEKIRSGALFRGNRASGIVNQPDGVCSRVVSADRGFLTAYLSVRVSKITA